MERKPTYEELVVRLKEAELIINEKDAQIQNLKKSESIFEGRFILHKLIVLFADILPLVITLVDLKGNCLYLNQFGIKLSGYNQADVAKGLNVIDLLADPADFNAFIARVSSLQNDKETMTGDEFLIKNKAGELFYMLIYSQIVINTNNEPLLLGILVDHTHYRKVGDEYIKAEQKLREMNAAKDKFLSIIAHDLKNPYNAILGFCELILSNIQSHPLEQIESYINVMHKSASKGLVLLENLLNWSMSQTGKIGFKRSSFDLSELLSENVDFLSEKAAIKGIKLACQCNENLIVSADKNMIDTVLRNLLSNAIKFTRANGLVEVSVTKNEHSHFQVTIADNGVGMSEKDQKRLFRLDTIFSTQGTAFEQGTGLGLVLCHDFIQKHDGKIWAESEPGKGSKFHFTLPADKSHS